VFVETYDDLAAFERHLQTDGFARPGRRCRNWVDGSFSTQLLRVLD